MGRLSFLFFYTLGLILILSSFFSTWPLLFFAPFLISSFYRQDKIRCLWLAVLCGLIIDLLSSQMPLGFYALNYVLTVGLLYQYKYHFFEDSLSTLPILVSLFSFLSTLILAGQFYLFGQAIQLSWQWFKIDLIGMPLYDGIYAFIAFNLPILFFSRRSYQTRSQTNLRREKRA